MEKQPLKRNKNIIQLSKNHHLTLLFCWKIRTGLKLNVETGRIKAYVQYFWQTHMEPHFNEEETILFATVKDAAVQKAINEHAAIKHQVSEIVTSDYTESLQLKMFADAIDDHVRYEERELFPHLEKTLTETQLEYIGNQLQQIHNTVCKDDFTDAFWVK
jgi:hemerythrin-like domain-containing protein